MPDATDNSRLLTCVKYTKSIGYKKPPNPLHRPQPCVGNFDGLLGLWRTGLLSTKTHRALNTSIKINIYATSGCDQSPTGYLKIHASPSIFKRRVLDHRVRNSGCNCHDKGLMTKGLLTVTSNQTPLPPHSLVRRLTRLNLSVLLASMITSFVLIGALLWFIARERQGDAVELAGLQTASNLAAMLVFGDKVEASRELSMLASRRDLSAIAVYDSQKQLFSTIHLPVPELLEGSPVVQRHYQGLIIELVIPILQQQEVVGHLIIHESMHQLRNWFLQGLVLMSTTMALLYLLCARILVRIQQQALQPLVELSALAEKVAKEQNFRLRARVYRNDELGSLSRRFNELLKRTEIWQSELKDQLQQANEHSEQLTQLAMHDSLTGLENRHAFSQRLSSLVVHSQQHQQRLALLFIDLDNFKYVNDTYGHEAGDALLILVSQRLAQVLRNVDSLCRLGGDEFAVLLPHQSQVNATELVCQRLLAQMREPLVIQGHVMPVGASIGVAFCPDHATAADQLLQLADQAMYIAKRAGKNGYHIWQPNDME